MKKIYISFISILLFLSCKNNEIENKLDNAITEIKSLKEKNKSDSISGIETYKNLLDSVKINKSTSLDLSTQYEKLKSSIFIVYTSNEFERYQGTAFLIDNLGTCLSNFHIFKNIKNAVLVNNNGNKYNVEDIIYYSEERDFIIFKIDLKDEFINPLKIAVNNPKIGEECFTIGNPRGLDQTLSTGIVSGYREGKKIIQTTTEITHGSSGGPLFNNQSEVIGITTSGLGEANINFAVNINQIDLSNNVDINNISNEYFVVIDQRAYFHNYPDVDTRRNSYLVFGDSGNVIESRNGFVYVIYKNENNQISKGWISNQNIKFE